MGDFGGGGLMLANGMVCALQEAQRSDQRQVVDAALVDGADLLMGRSADCVPFTQLRDSEPGLKPRF